MRTYVHKQVSPQMLREKMLELDVLQSQVQRATGMPRAWWNRMIQDNRHQFDNPDPARMQAIWKWLIHYEKFRDRYND